MKLRSIGSNYPMELTGIILTPEEYKNHPGYYPFYHISSDTLFVATDDELNRPCPRLNGIVPLRASAFALLEATEEEKKRLRAAGYKMLNLEND